MNKLLLLCFIMLIGFQSWSQTDDQMQATNCYYISNAEVVTKPGMIQSGTSIVIRDGVIADIGKGIPIPYDAKVIKADSLYVYAGFIDPFSHTGIKEEDKDKKAKDDKPSSPGAATLKQAGITPQMKGSDRMSVKEKSIEAMRKAGFVISHAVPKGYIIPGQGSIISLKKSTNKADLILRKDVSMITELRTKRGVFPSTLIGAMSRLREVYTNTGLYKKNLQAYSMNPSGMKRPSYVTEYDAMLPVIDRKMPVFFKSTKPKNIHRAVTLQKELGFDMVLVDVKLVSPILNIIKPNTPILLSLDLPKEIKDKDAKDEDKDNKDNKDNKDKKEEKEKEVKPTDAEKERLTSRKMESYNLYMNQAKMLADKNIPFSFSYVKTKGGDVIKNIKRLIKTGITEDQALKALTTTPAKMLNISNVAGTVERGKMGSLVITSKPLFEDESKIKYVFVEGQMTEMKEKKKKKKEKKGDGTLGDIEGKWRYEAEVPGDEQRGILHIGKDGDSYTISLESDDEPGELDEASDVSVDGTSLTFNVNIAEDGASMIFSFDVDFIDDVTFEGTVDAGEFGSFPFKGTKKDSPDQK